MSALMIIVGPRTILEFLCTCTCNSCFEPRYSYIKYAQYILYVCFSSKPLNHKQILFILVETSIKIYQNIMNKPD